MLTNEKSLSRFLCIYSYPELYFQVTPVGRQALTYDGDSWKEKGDEVIEENTDSSSKSFDSKQSKAKRVKNYLKNKCKNALGNKSSSSDISSSSESSSWYLEKITNKSEISELSEVFEDASENLGSIGSDEQYQVANVILIKDPVEDDTCTGKEINEKDGDVKRIENECGDNILHENTSSLLTQLQEEIDSNEDDAVDSDILEIEEDMKKVSYYQFLYKIVQMIIMDIPKNSFLFY
ncbi:hypothetical protein HHI36_019941 [Cryptolaemus montrouzieri]|uniref:Uncharacterized protein n=1 Tax=Cryptolaemus montrouzieri TaxID=559131 RepID=A0ABD2NAD9_9CUCU